MTADHTDTTRRRNLLRQEQAQHLDVAMLNLCTARFDAMPPHHSGIGPCTCCPILEPCGKAAKGSYPMPRPDDSSPADKGWHMAVQFRNLNRAARRVLAPRSDSNPGNPDQ